MESIKSSVVKSQAKQALSHQWAIAIVASFIVMAFSMIGNVVEYLYQYVYMIKNMVFVTNDLTMEQMMNMATNYSAPLSVSFFSNAVSIVTIPLTYGMAAFFITMIRNGNVEIKQVFSKYKQFGKCFITSLYVDILVMLQTFLFIIPGIIAAFRYAMTTYIIADNPDISTTEAVTMSKEMMKGHKWELFCIQLSFIGWFILAGFTCGVLYVIFVLPYFEATMAAFYDRVKFQYDSISGTHTIDIV